MANKNLFRSIVGKLLPAANVVNEAGGKAYALSPQHTLAELAATGCLNATFYASAERQLAKLMESASEVSPEFLAKTAVFARERGKMKDMPAALAAVLSLREPALLVRIFDRVIDDAKMLRNFVQIVRSGAVGRKSLGTVPKRLVTRWLSARSDEALFHASVGQSPSIADVVKMVHPKPATAERRALYGYLLGRAHQRGLLPEAVLRFEEFKDSRAGEVPDVPFQMLTALGLGTAEWTAIARRAGWQMTRMNLNTFVRHGVFERDGMPELIAARLRDSNAIARARVLPYQLMVAHATAQKAPACVREALQDAMEIALGNVAAIPGKVWIFPDVSGSMRSPITGVRKGATSTVRCVDVAALVAAALVRKNSSARVMPFEHRVVPIDLNPRDSVMTNAAKLAAIGGGGTACSAPLAELNRTKQKGDLVIYVSDNESWADPSSSKGTRTLEEWQRFRSRNPAAKLVCLDLQPHAHTQALERADVMNIGGFSDQVFDVMASFARGELNPGHWVGVIEQIAV